MRQLQLIAHGEPSDVIELTTVSEPPLGQEDVLISMEAAPLNPSDFLFVRGMYGVRPAFPSSVGAEGVGRVASGKGISSIPPIAAGCGQRLVARLHVFSGCARLVGHPETIPSRGFR